MKGDRPPPTAGEKLAAQVPGVIGIGCIAAALAYVWYAKTYPPHVIYFGPIEILVAVGFVSIGWWTFASK